MPPGEPRTEAYDGGRSGGGRSWSGMGSPNGLSGVETSLAVAIRDDVVSIVMLDRI